MSTDDDGDDPDGQTRTIDDLPAPSSLAAGFGTFVASYLVFLGTIATTAENVNLSGGIGEVLSGIGYLFYNAHNVPVRRFGQLVQFVNQTDPETGETTSRRISQEIDQTQNILANAQNTAVPTEVYFIVPVVVLAIAAVGLAYYYRESLTDGVGIGVVAGTFTVGYLLAAMVGTFLIAQTASNGETQITLRPAQIDALLYGTAYPLAAVVVAILAVVGLREVGAFDQA